MAHVSNMTQPEGYRVSRSEHRPDTRQMVRIRRVEWEIAKVVAKEELGLTVGALCGLLLSNWVRKRWPLDLEVGR